MKNSRSLNFFKQREKKIHNTISNFVVFLFGVFLLSSFTTQTLIVFGQNNQTDSSSENDVIRSIPEDGPELANQDTEQLISENSSSSSVPGDSSNTTQNSNNDLTQETGSNDLSQPDRECLFDPSMPKCAPDENGKCPKGFAMNENGQCFPRGGCPDGYHSVDDDETGRCIPNSAGCPTDMIFRPNMKSCGEKEYVCSQYPELKACRGRSRSSCDSSLPTLSPSFPFQHECNLTRTKC